MLRQLRLRVGLLRHLRPKSAMLLPLRLKMGVFFVFSYRLFVATLRDPGCD